MSWFASIGDLLETHHEAAREAVRGLPVEALDFRSEHIRNSLGVLAWHLSGSERFWIGEILGGEPSHRDRDAEFATRGRTDRELIERIDEVAAHSRRILEGMSAADLDAVRELPRSRSARTVTGGWVVLHALEHTAYHAGQMNLIRKLLRDREV